jgi:hypothetical protein
MLHNTAMLDPTYPDRTYLILSSHLSIYLSIYLSIFPPDR